MPPKATKKKSVEPIEPETPIESKEIDFDEEIEKPTKEMPTVEMVNIGKMQLQENKEQKEKKKKQLRNSNYFITINPNIRSVEDSKQMHDQIKKLTEALDSMQPKIIEWLVIKEPKVEINKNTIKSVKFEYSVEWKDCVHAHIQLLISHYTRVQINPVWMQNHIKTHLGIPITQKIHFDYKLLRDNKTTLEDYLRKQYKPGGVLAKK
jgi:hypothetical protein